MRQEEIELAWAKTKMKVSIHKESENGRLTRTRRMKGGESIRELRLSLIHQYHFNLFIFYLLIHFYLFYIDYLHQKALDFLYFTYHFKMVTVYFELYGTTYINERNYKFYVVIYKRNYV